LINRRIVKMILFSAYPAYLLNAYHVNYQLKMLTSNQLQLHDILYNNSSLAYFIEVREKDLSLKINERV
jgi:hypothetical protein